MTDHLPRYRAGLAHLGGSNVVRGLATGALVLAMLVGAAPSALADDDDDDRGEGRGRGSRNGNVYALTDDNMLLSFDAGSPNRIRSRMQITGIAGDLIGIDFRPANGMLYSVNRQGQIYTIDADTAVATTRAQMNVAPLGGRFGFDFNPNADRLRIVSDQDQNLRVDVDNGTATVDGPIAYAANDRNAGRNPNAVGAAYTGPDTDPNTPTTLYDVDSSIDVLARQDPPNNGTLNTVGDLGLDVADLVGFDIGPLGRVGGNGSNNDNSRNDNSRNDNSDDDDDWYNDDDDDDDAENDNSDGGMWRGGMFDGSDQALAAFQRQNGQTRLYSIDLNSGRARNIGRIGDNEQIDGLAISLGMNR